MNTGIDCGHTIHTRVRTGICVGEAQREAGTLRCLGEAATRRPAESGGVLECVGSITQDRVRALRTERLTSIPRAVSPPPDVAHGAWQALRSARGAASRATGGVP